MSSPAEILLAHAQAQLADQASRLESIRNRAATVLTAAGVVAGFYAVSGHTAAVAASALTFGVGAALGVVILIPIYSWHFAGNIQNHLKWARDAATDQGDQLALTFAAGLDDQRRKNKRKLDVLTWLLSIQCTLLAAQVVIEAVAKGLS